jgi:hypothetical protein
MVLLGDVSLVRRNTLQCVKVLSSTGTLACAGFAALIIDEQPRVAVLLDRAGHAVLLLAVKSAGNLRGVLVRNTHQKGRNDR